MIVSNLKILLAEKRLKITRVTNDTGISRTTLTSLSEGYAKGINFDTINTLCMYLSVMPNDILKFTPIDFFVNISDIEEIEYPYDTQPFYFKAAGFINMEKANVKKSFEWWSTFLLTTNDYNSEKINDVSIVDDNGIGRIFLNEYHNLPTIFQTQLKQDLGNAILNYFNDNLQNLFKNYSVSICDQYSIDLVNNTQNAIKKISISQIIDENVPF